MRIGIEAPRSLPVHREEVLLRQTKQGIVVENVSPQESFPSKISSDTPSKTTQKEAVLEDWSEKKNSDISSYSQY